MEKKFSDLNPSILGMNWAESQLILVGARPGGAKTQYVLGNVVVRGTKGEIPVALFAPGEDRQRIMDMLIRMQVGDLNFEGGSISSKKFKNFPVYIDDTPHLTVPYLVDRIFHLAGEQGVQLFVIDYLQTIDGSMLDSYTKEREMNNVLRVLKALTESMRITIIVTSSLSNYAFSAKETTHPDVRSILYATEAEELCDQIILIQPLMHLKNFTNLTNAFNIVLPKAFSYDDGQHEQIVIHATFDYDKRYFKKARYPFKEPVEIADEAAQAAEETRMYQWYRKDEEDSWHFEFLDSEGMGWTIHLIEADGDVSIYQILVRAWTGEEIILDHPISDDIDFLKTKALDLARRKFPDVEILEK